MNKYIGNHLFDNNLKIHIFGFFYEAGKVTIRSRNIRPQKSQAKQGVSQ